LYIGCLYFEVVLYVVFCDPCCLCCWWWVLFSAHLHGLGVILVVVWFVFCADLVLSLWYGRCLVALGVLVWGCCLRVFVCVVVLEFLLYCCRSSVSVRYIGWVLVCWLWDADLFSDYLLCWV